jgi:hypothetical protein
VCPAPLAALAPAYLSDRPGGRKVDEEALRQALDWATTRVNDTVALLEEADDGYSVLDYALDHLTAQHTPIPQAAWDAALEHAPPGDLVRVGYEAAIRYDRRDVAETAWHRSAAHGEAGAMYNLGLLLERRGDPVEAERWWRKADGPP